jgi:hypothetical protein
MTRVVPAEAIDLQAASAPQNVFTLLGLVRVRLHDFAAAISSGALAADTG